MATLKIFVDAFYPKLEFLNPMTTLELVPVHAVPLHEPVPAVLVHTSHGGSRAVPVHCPAILNTLRNNKF